MVVLVLDEVVPGATYIFAAEQGAQCVPLVGGLLHFVIIEEENNPTKIH